MSNDEKWIQVGSSTDLGEGSMRGIEHGDLQIAIYNLEGELYATDNICTHGAGSLCEGWLEGFEIECPLHQGRFDVRDGRPLCTPATEAIRVYPAKVVEGRVLLDLG